MSWTFSALAQQGGTAYVPLPRGWHPGAGQHHPFTPGDPYGSDAVQAVGYTGSTYNFGWQEITLSRVADSSRPGPTLSPSRFSTIGFWQLDHACFLAVSPPCRLRTRSMGSRPWRRCRWAGGSTTTHRRSYLLHRTG